jgi:hypothetical protein
MWLKLCGLGLLLAGLLISCEQEGVLEESGEKVAVNILLGDVIYSGNETVTRGYVEEAETVRVALGRDLFIYTTIKKDGEAEMRAESGKTLADNAEMRAESGETLKDNVKVRVVAYEGTTIAATAEYTVLNGALTTATALEVSTGTAYTFVAYSYNSSTSPDYPDSSEEKITVKPSRDLLWGNTGSTPKMITAEDNSVAITMSHLFSQVKVKLTTDNVSEKPHIMSLSGVSLSPGNEADLTIRTGKLEANAAVAPQNVSVWTGFDKVDVLSNPITVYTGTANPIYLNINSVTIDGYDDPFTGIQARFKKTLVAGTSYTLVVSFKKTIWAKSNIYWDGGKLTFDTQENGHQGYQGVYFKFGSLIGISPALVGGANVYKNTAVPIYVPVVDLNDIKDSYWNSTTTTAMGYSAWGSYESPATTDIPYMDKSFTDDYGRDGTMAIDEANNDPETMWANYRGDICQYLCATGAVDGDYRLPTSNEFGPENSATNWTSQVSASGWQRGDGTFAATLSAGYPDGRADFLSSTRGTAFDSSTPSHGGASATDERALGSGINVKMGEVVFPATGMRIFNQEGTLGNVGSTGTYWSGSAGSSSGGTLIYYAYYLGFTNASVYPHWSAPRNTGHAVRCIRN